MVARRPRIGRPDDIRFLVTPGGENLELGITRQPAPDRGQIVDEIEPVPGCRDGPAVHAGGIDAGPGDEIYPDPDVSPLAPRHTFGGRDTSWPVHQIPDRAAPAVAAVDVAGDVTSERMTDRQGDHIGRGAVEPPDLSERTRPVSRRAGRVGGNLDRRCPAGRWNARVQIEIFAGSVRRRPVIGPDDGIPGRFQRQI